MAGRPRKEVTPEMADSMCRMLEAGMSIEGVANMHGMSDMTLLERRKEDDDLDARILCARAKYELSLTTFIAENMGSAEADRATKERANQFPRRHGELKHRLLHNEHRLADVPDNASAGSVDAEDVAAATAVVIALKKAGTL